MSFWGWFWIWSHLGSYFSSFMGLVIFFSGLVIFEWVSSTANFTFLVAGYFHIYLWLKVCLCFILGAVNLLGNISYQVLLFSIFRESHSILQSRVASTPIADPSLAGRSSIYTQPALSSKAFFLFWWFFLQTHQVFSILMHSSLLSLKLERGPLPISGEISHYSFPFTGVLPCNFTLFWPPQAPSSIFSQSGNHQSLLGFPLSALLVGISLWVAFFSNCMAHLDYFSSFRDHILQCLMSNILKTIV